MITSDVTLILDGNWHVFVIVRLNQKFSVHVDEFSFTTEMLHLQELHMPWRNNLPITKSFRPLTLDVTLTYPEEILNIKWFVLQTFNEDYVFYIPVVITSVWSLLSHISWLSWICRTCSGCVLWADEHTKHSITIFVVLHCIFQWSKMK